MLLGAAQPHRFPGILCSVVKGKKAQGKGHCVAGHPKEPPAEAAVGALPEKPAVTRFWGLLCQPAGLVLSCAVPGLLPARAERECRKCLCAALEQQPLAASAAVLRGSLSDTQSACVTCSPSTLHLRVRLSGAAAWECKTEPEQKQWRCTAANGVEEGAWHALPSRRHVSHAVGALSG